MDPNGVIKRRAIKRGCPGSPHGADMKRKPPCCCWYSGGCFRILLSARAPSCCPVSSVLQKLRERGEAALGCLVIMRGKQLKVSSSAPTPSKQPAATLDSHRNQAVQDCISYINSATASSSATSTSTSSSSPSLSSTDMVILPPLKSNLPQIPPKSVVAEPVITVPAALPPPPPPPCLPCTSNSKGEPSEGLTVEKSTRSPCP
ncbi:hypothetical protein MLD38_008391 [Melastoma candidum]|uniref:Uncharacterized protein n=1 Tax=Melastoma candidum TaxID=119954 RepID=A0ACB9RTS9_9MYRT|nr:hypothetical protein MLD38_008391 [Melastoma candidum]